MISRNGMGDGRGSGGAPDRPADYYETVTRRDMALKARRVDSDVPVKPFMSGQKEHDTVKAFVNILSSQPVTFHDDFQELPEKTLKKVPVLQVSARIDHLHGPKRTPSPCTLDPQQLEVPSPPEVKKEESSGMSGPNNIISYPF